MTKMIVAKRKRPTGVAGKLILWIYVHELQSGVIRSYLDCNSHLISFYAKLGFVTYKDDIYSDEYGSVTPMKIEWRDSAHLNRIRSPLRRALKAFETRHIDDYMEVYGALAERDDAHGQLDEGSYAECGMNYIFDGLNQDEMARVFRVASSHAYKADDWILCVGDETLDFFVVLDGQTAIMRRTEGGDEVAIALFSRGQVMGEMGYLRGQARSASVKAVSDCRLLRFSPPVIDSLLNDEAAIAVKIFRNLSIILSHRLAKTTEDWFSTLR